MEHVTRIAKTKIRINSHRVKEVGTVVPAEAGIREEMIIRGIPEMGTGKNPVL
jgi:hypothetical protein